jgi:cytochrome P450
LNSVTTLAGFRQCEGALRNTQLKQSLYDAGEVVMRGVLLTLHGADHAARRAVEVRVFRRNFFFHYEKEVFPVTLEETLRPFLAAGNGDLIEFGYRATANLTADFAGVDRPRKTPEESEKLIRLVKKLSEGATLVHSKRDPAEVEPEVRAALAEFDRDFLQPSIARRRSLLAKVDDGLLSEDELPRDVLTVILRAEEELQMGEDQLLREVAFYMQAGAHSTANSVVHAFHEIHAWAGNDTERWTRLKNPAFVQRCVHESLRLHPASPEAWRTATCSLHMDSVGEMESGDRVVLDLFSANRDPAIFGETANIFDPDRSIPPGMLPSGLAFGIGLHTCVGRELDGGVVAKPGSTSDQLGIVPLLVNRLLELNVRLNPRSEPKPDLTTSRPNWGSYPVLFSESA